MSQRSQMTLWFIVVSSLIGALLSSWLAPKFISWYFNPPAQFGVSCLEPIQWAMSRLRWTQFIGTFIGGLVGLVLSFMRVAKRTNEEK